MANFFPLKVKDIKKETNDTVSVSFELNDSIKNQFNYTAGQYITLKLNIAGEELRRSYSLCSAPEIENDFRVAIKHVKDGRVSGYLNQQLKVGDTIEVMNPAGNFTVKNSKNNLVAFVAGSGITPVFSIIKYALKKQQNSITLFYGNKDHQSIIFKEELSQLAKENQDRLKVVNILSRETIGDSLFEGRITKQKAKDLIRHYQIDLQNSTFYLCGPEQMIREVSEVMQEQGVSKENILFELFTTPVQSKNETPIQVVGNFSGQSTVTVIMDDEQTTFELSTKGNNILDAAINAGVDAPFSCKGAVCCTCKAKIVEGSVSMDMNYALSDSEVAEGYILTCQSHPTSEKLIIDYDVV
jgi:ring-1,2-phenylacetyl-CoA epoxidase subunit PaaE